MDMGLPKKLVQEILHELNLNLVAAIGQNKKILSTVRTLSFLLTDSFERTILDTSLILRKINKQ